MSSVIFVLFVMFVVELHFTNVTMHRNNSVVYKVCYIVFKIYAANIFTDTVVEQGFLR